MQNLFWKTFVIVANTESSEMDMIMLTLFNAREREKTDWIDLLQKADPRFKNTKIWTPEGATLAIIEAYWEG